MALQSAMRTLLTLVLTASITLTIAQDRFPDVPEQYTGGPNVEILVDELRWLKIIEGEAWPRSSDMSRFEQAVAIYAGYRALMEPKLSRRIGNGYAWMANKLRRATMLREKELASLGVDVEGMKQHLRALELGEGFPDVPPNHWASKATRAFKDKGLLKGYPDGLFRGR